MADIEIEAERPEETVPSFEVMGLDSRLLRALTKRGLSDPTAVQAKCIPLAMEGKDIVARARTGSGKTLAYLLPMIHQILASKGNGEVSSGGGLRSLVLVPTKELCHQVRNEAAALAAFCGTAVTVTHLSTGMTQAAMRAALQGSPDLVVATPGRVAACLRDGIITSDALQQGLSMLVLDEADLLLSYGYEEDVRTLSRVVPRKCQCLLMSATTSADVEKMKKLILHNPVTLTLTQVEGGGGGGGGVPSSVTQHAIRCGPKDKLLVTLALLRLQLIQPKALIFVSTIDAGFRLRLFLEQFGLRCAVLNAELPQNSRLHILHEFNRGLFDYLIATDDGGVGGGRKGAGKGKKEGKGVTEGAGEGEEEEAKGMEAVGEGREAGGDGEEKVNKRGREEEEGAKGAEEGGVGSKRRKGEGKKGTGEFGVVRGIDFKDVKAVINLTVPSSTTAYIHRVGRTGRAGSKGTAVTLVSPAEEATLAEIDAELAAAQDEPGGEQSVMGAFPALVKEAVEALRYRAEDVARGITRHMIREARAKELRLEMLNSERLKAHFEDNPNDQELLQHDKVLSKAPPAPHLKMVPAYLRVSGPNGPPLLPPRGQKSAVGYLAKRRIGQKKGGGMGLDPLRTFSLKGRGKDVDEPPEVAAALAGTLWARKKEKERLGKRKGGGDGGGRKKEGVDARKLGKFQASRKGGGKKR